MNIILLIFLFALNNLNLQSDFYSIDKSATSEKLVVDWLALQPDSNLPLAVYSNGINSRQKNIYSGYSNLFYTDSRDYFGFMKLETIKKSPKLNVEWYDHEGNQLGSFAEMWDYDFALPQFFIQHDNQYLISVDLANRLRTINGEGAVINEHHIFPDYTYHNENIIFTRLLEKKKQLLCGLTQIRKTGSVNPLYSSTVLLRGLNKELKFNLLFSGWQLHAIDVSADGNIVVGCLYKVTYPKNSIEFKTIFLDASGVEFGQIPYRYRNACFSVDGQYVLLVDKNVGFIYDLATRSLVQKIKTRHTDNIFTAATFLGSENLLATQEATLLRSKTMSNYPWQYNDPIIQTFDSQGSTINTMNFEGVVIYNPAFWYDEANQSLFFGHSSGWLRLKQKIKYLDEK